MDKKTEIALFEAQGVRYNELLHKIVAEIKMTCVVIANRINSSVIQLYWNIGKRLSLEKIDKGYGGFSQNAYHPFYSFCKREGKRHYQFIQPDSIECRKDYHEMGIKT